MTGTNISGPDANYRESIVAFVDLLGFKEAVGSRARTKEILALLIQFSDSRAEMESEINGQMNGAPFSLKPAISAFSDHVVISLPWLPSLSVALLTILNFYVSQLADHALKKHFLIRGGIALGLLYHQQDIVFGPALVEAAELESKLAIYPRVILSQMLQTVFNHLPKQLVVYDRDGLYSLNTMGTMFPVDAAPLSNDEWYLLVERRLENYKAIIKDELSKFAAVDGQVVSAMTKWQWSLHNLEDQIAIIKQERQNQEQIKKEMKDLELNRPK